MYGVIYLQIFVKAVSPCNEALFYVPIFTKILIEMTTNEGTAKKIPQLTAKVIDNQFHFRSWLLKRTNFTDSGIYAIRRKRKMDF